MAFPLSWEQSLPEKRPLCVAESSPAHRVAPLAPILALSSFPEIPFSGFNATDELNQDKQQTGVVTSRCCQRWEAFVQCWPFKGR